LQLLCLTAKTKLDCYPLLSCTTTLSQGQTQQYIYIKIKKYTNTNIFQYPRLGNWHHTRENIYESLAIYLQMMHIWV